MHLPEKHYESCITYGLIEDFWLRFNQRIYPFAFSQVNEKQHGLDFGYSCYESFFFLQYKRPYQTQNDIYWNIDINQLKTIYSLPFSSSCFYALPAFFEIQNWYYGLKECFFVSAPILYDALFDEGTAQKRLHIDNPILSKWEDIFENTILTYNNVSNQVYTQSISAQHTINALSDRLNSCDSAWLYFIEKGL